MTTTRKLTENTLRIANAARSARAAIDENYPQLAAAYLEVVIAASDAIEAMENEIVQALNRAESAS